MTENKPRRLSDVVESLVPEGANDRRWFMVEQLLMDAKIDVQIARDYLKDIRDQPENENEREIAEDCLDIIAGMYLDILEHYAAFLSYLSDTDVPERIARKEL